MGAGGQQSLAQNPLFAAVLASAVSSQQVPPPGLGLGGLPGSADLLQPNFFQSLLLLNSATSQQQMMSQQGLFNSQVRNKIQLSLKSLSKD
jgi:hypothetical protein